MWAAICRPSPACRRARNITILQLLAGIWPEKSAEVGTRFILVALMLLPLFRKALRTWHCNAMIVHNSRLTRYCAFADFTCPPDHLPSPFENIIYVGVSEIISTPNTLLPLPYLPSGQTMFGETLLLYLPLTLHIARIRAVFRSCYSLFLEFCAILGICASILVTHCQLRAEKTPVPTSRNLHTQR